MPSKTLNFYRATYAALMILAAGIFTSVSFSALSHVLFVISGPYFLINGGSRYLKEMPKSFWLFIALIFTCLISVILNIDIIESPLKNMIKTKYFIIGLLAAFAVKETKKHYLDDKKIKILLTLFIIATTIATISGLIGLWSGFNPLKMKKACHLTRACGLYGMYMTYGYGISLFMILLSSLIFYKKKVEKFIDTKILWMAWIINIVGLIFSFARGGWLGFLLAAPFIVLKKSKKAFGMICLGSFVLFSSAFFMSDKVYDVFTKRSGSNQQRIAFYQTAAKAALEKPFFGWGYRNFEPNVKKLKAKYDLPFKYLGGHAHNNLFEHLASTGFIGALITLFLFLMLMYESFKRDDIVALVAFPFFVSFFISGMTQYTFGDGENLFLFMGIVSLFYASYPLKTSESLLEK